MMPGENASPYVDHSKCQDCAECCKKFAVYYPKDAAPSEIQNMILISYRAGVDIQIHESDAGYYLVYNHACKHLKKSKGKWYCRVYGTKTRPAVCALYPYADTTKEHCPHLLDEPQEDQPTEAQYEGAYSRSVDDQQEDGINDPLDAEKDESGNGFW